MAGHVFVDESRRRGYLLVAAVVMPSELDATRRALRSLVMPGQRRLHMTKESNARRDAIIAAIRPSGVEATIYDAGRTHRQELDAREACLRVLVRDAADASHHMIVIEQDDSVRWWDQQRLIEITREVGCRDSLRYEHQRAENELLLGIPDAIAWCWARGGQWRDRINDLVHEVRTV